MIAGWKQKCSLVLAFFYHLSLHLFYITAIPCNRIDQLDIRFVMVGWIASTPDKIEQYSFERNILTFHGKWVLDPFFLSHVVWNVKPLIDLKTDIVFENSDEIKKGWNSVKQPARKDYIFFYKICWRSTIISNSNRIFNYTHSLFIF